MVKRKKERKKEKKKEKEKEKERKKERKKKKGKRKSDKVDTEDWSGWRVRIGVNLKARIDEGKVSGEG